MTDSPSQPTIREWRRHLGHPVTLAVLSGIAALLSLSGAFGTDGHLGLISRLAYWWVLVVLTYGVGSAVGMAMTHWIGDKLGKWVVVGLTALAIGSAVSVIVFAMNVVVFGFVPRGETLGVFLVTIYLSAAVITTVLQIVEDEVRKARVDSVPHQTQAEPPRIPAIMDRLPVDKRAPLLALSVEDHYVRVQTLVGTEMVLMRLSDAIRETDPVAGLQVHRSHWVALDAVASVRRDKDRAILTLSSGTEIPVSRANLPKIKEAGLLPR